MNSKSDKIRVGIIRCDTHGYWYAHFFEKPDPDLMRKHHRGCHYYFHRNDDPGKLRYNSIPGMVITKVFDEKDRKDEEVREKAEGLSKVYHGRPKVCDSYEEVSDDVDLVYIADCSYEGKDHLKFAAPGLKKGVPHFVDKPFAFTLKDAKEMIALAKKHNTAVMCASLMRFSPYMQRFRQRFADIAPVSRLLVPAGGPGLNSVFHGLSAVQNIMGEGCEWVESMGSNLYDVLCLHYPTQDGGLDAIVFNARGIVPDRIIYPSFYHHCAYTVYAYGAGGAVYSPQVDDYLFLEGGIRIVKMAKKMAQTKKPPINYDSMLELMKMIEAARLAHNKGKRVKLKDVE